jgi:hypothetical protein
MSGAEAIIGVVSGGAGLLSLAVQLGENVQKLKAACDAIRNAPQTLDELVFDMETITLWIQQLEEHRREDPHDAALLLRCAERCHRSVDKISAIVDRLASFMKRHPRSGKVSIIFRGPELDTLLDALEREKSNLQLAYTSYMFAEQTRQFSVQRQILERLSIHSCPGEHTGLQPINDHTSCPIGGHNDIDVIQRYTKQKRKTYSFAIYWPVWLSSSVWRLALVSSTSGWDISFRTYLARPANAEIFIACETGNLERMQQLFISGQASPLDVNISDGQTLLEVSQIIL